MLIVEFFGPSGAGKTYFKKKFLKKYFLKFKVYSYKSINLKLNNHNLITKLYFNFIKSKFSKKIKHYLKSDTLQLKFLNYFYKSYQKKLSKRNFKNNDLVKLKYVSNLIDKSNFNYSQKKNFLRWSKEELNGFNLAKNYSHNGNLLIDSEGLIQRLFIYCYKKKNKEKIIKNYLNTIDLPDVLISFSNEKSQKNINFNINKKELKIIYSITMNYLKKKRILILNSSQKMDLIYKRVNKKYFKHLNK